MAPPPELWAWMIGSLAEGGLWLPTPNGPIVLDPMLKSHRPYLQRAYDARKHALEAFRTLAALGALVEAETHLVDDAEDADDEGVAA